MQKFALILFTNSRIEFLIFAFELSHLAVKNIAFETRDCRDHLSNLFFTTFSSHSFWMVGNNQMLICKMEAQ